MKERQRKLFEQLRSIGIDPCAQKPVFDEETQVDDARNALKKYVEEFDGETQGAMDRIKQYLREKRS